MIDKKLDLVFELRHQKDEVEIALKAIDATKAPHLERLEAINTRLSELNQEVLDAMESKNVKTYTYGINNVTAAIRRTLGIVDEAKLMEAISHQAAKIGKSIGMPVKEIKAKSFLKVLNKPFVKEIADSYLKVEGKPLDGTEMKETKYLTIK